MPTLTELAAKYGTDKQEVQHNYMIMYEKELCSLKVNSLLEIGLGKGSSIKMWMEYFPKAQVYCIENFGRENNDVWGHFKGDIKGLNLISGDSSIEKTWRDIPHNLDVIVEDGDHNPEMQLATFLIGLKHLRKGGLYFIEDTHVGFIQPEFYGEGRNPLYEWVFSSIINQQEAYNPAYMPGNFALQKEGMNDIAQQIFSYKFYKSVIVFEKA
jgi:hypothetical protein